MTLTYRLEKGAPLTTEEIDNNFRELEKRLWVLEEKEPSAEEDSKQPLCPSLPVYEKGSLPLGARKGALALLQNEESLILVLFNGTTWQNIEKGETL